VVLGKRLDRGVIREIVRSLEASDRSIDRLADPGLATEHATQCMRDTGRRASSGSGMITVEEGTSPALLRPRGEADVRRRCARVQGITAKIDKK
jgi:hypothetical protein